MTQDQFDGTRPPPPAAPPAMPPPPLGSVPADLPEPPVTFAAPPTWRDRWRKFTAPIGGGIAVLYKLKILTLLVKLKFLLFFGSTLVSFAAYAWLYGWRFALGLVGLLLVHEFGHILVFRARGARVSLPTLVPFFGAFVKAAPRSVYDGALGGLAGPGIGGLGSLVALSVWNVTDQEAWRAVAAFGFFINLVNLAPIGILDGGNVWRAARGKLSNGKGSPRIHALSPEQRRVIWAVYIALIVVLGYATKLTYFSAQFQAR